MTQSGEDLAKGKKLAKNVERLVESPSFRLAYRDDDFLSGRSARPVRLQLEFLKPEVAFEEHQINSTIVVFGSARILSKDDATKRLRLLEEERVSSGESETLEQEIETVRGLLSISKYYDQAREFARIVSQAGQTRKGCDYVICTGGGPGIMEAANRGAYEVGAKSIGLNIHLPMEQLPNPYISPELCFNFHYFAMRKLHFMLRARAMAFFPGGFGTLDELFEGLTLRQTERMQPLPIVMFGKEYWDKLIDFDYMARMGTISPRDYELIRFFDSPKEGWNYIQKYYESLNNT